MLGRPSGEVDDPHSSIERDDCREKRTITAGEDVDSVAHCSEVPSQLGDVDVLTP
jgi:hypothetical protein